MFCKPVHLAPPQHEQPPVSRVPSLIRKTSQQERDIVTVTQRELLGAVGLAAGSAAIAFRFSPEIKLIT
jgi:hypothetical protein